MIQNNRKRTIILRVLCIIFIIIGIVSIAYQLNKTKYININNYKLVYLQNRTGVCYFNVVMQCFYNGKWGKYIMENNYEENTAGYEIKETLIKMMEGSNVDLRENYKKIYKTLNISPQDVDNGGSPFHLLHMLIFSLYDDKSEDKEIFLEYFGACVNDIYFKTYKFSREYNIDNFSIEKEIIKYKDKDSPYVLPYFFKDNIFRKDKHNIVFSFTLNNGRKYVLRTIICLKINKLRNHVFVITKGKTNWFCLNDSYFKSLRDNCVVNEIEGINALFYEIE